MRISAEEAFEEWANTNTHVAWSAVGLSRLDQAKYRATEELEDTMEYAFQAGWHSALRNLTTSDI
jgi:hypothetical protein